MIVLGIETSCDETSAAIVKDGQKVLSNEVASSLEFHKRYGGVIPEIASRIQLETITKITESAVKKARIKLKDIDLISVTNRPGLLGSLLVGISFAKSLSLALDRPLLGIDHVYSHFYANFLDSKRIELPFMALVVSGGHTSIFHVHDFNKIELLGETKDDACGEAFDKVAKILGLGYPGGPLIEKMAKLGNPKKIKLNCSGSRDDFNFSFSGIKTAILYLTRGRRISLKEKRDICASFQETVIDVLVRKTLAACRLKKSSRLLLGGGVVANNRLREKFILAQKSHKLDLYFPQKSLCMDNAAMVAGLGYQLFKKGYHSDLSLTVELN
ncbi:MAG: tRNA (adenosine(37)-N6)-threonylcarbamoyltransferase complex transferase subunit TsaD [Candidatus Omnitrophica bacterium]|nr:tRNA (adenosine(37)-N6)-threonylcarbamoyltransferase complex transferase subunit TsaD [Candidatus Omnitrophota bacterium]